MFTEILEYQAREKDLLEMEKEIGNSEERKRVSRAKKFLQDVDANLEDFDNKAQTLKNSIVKMREKSDALDDELKEYNTMLGKSKGEDENNYFVKKVSQLEDQINNLDKDIANVTGNIKQLLISFDEYKKKVKQAKDEFNEYKIKYDELRAEKRPAIDVVKADLAKIEATVPSEIMTVYKKVRDRKIYPAIVELMGSNCGGCRMELSMNRLSELKQRRFIECEECGRIIFIKD
ncbi:MAG: C4-type zinc ribbon domain-containing protein [Clostridia bacterium]